MRTVLRYEQGRAIWSDNVPSEPRSAEGWFRGSLLDTEPAHAPVNEARRKLSTAHPQKTHARSGFVGEFGDNALEGDTRNPQNQGVEAKIPEVPSVSVEP